jgi:hypothetical protein
MFVLGRGAVGLQSLLYVYSRLPVGETKGGGPGTYCYAPARSRAARLIVWERGALCVPLVHGLAR